MSVQGTARTANRGNEARLRMVKGIAFWGISAIGCFVFGWLVIAPLLPANGIGAHDESQSASARPPAPQSAPPSTAAVAPTPEEKKSPNGVRPDIELSVEPSSGSPQKPESMDGTNKDSGDTSTSLSEPREDRSPSLDEETPKATRRSARNRQTPETPEEEPSGTYTVEPDKQLVPDEPDRSDADKPKTRTHRATRRTRGAEAGSRPSSREKNSEIQKGESIDP